MKLPHLLSALTVITAVSAYELKVNYYSDGGCSDYLVSVWPSVVGDCYDYDYSGTNSANIADCKDFYACGCTFYQEKGCTGTESSPLTGSCKSNWGGGWKSMKCSGIPWA
ncbi:hypothetical protein BDW74DRAFT_172438 [Aspergillus multicolor]|uniref:uncharacterized protein n=1 Tax=Aspergillus multicolor TaxID=41759 RepID=UPI003CCCA82F